MSFDPLSAAFDLGKVAIERIWPDPTKQAEELRKLEELRQKGDLAEMNAHVQLMNSQLQVNAKEAEHHSIFVAGWRPFIGWVGGFALAYQFILYPLLLWLWYIFAPEDLTAPPIIDTGALFAIVTSMLGVGAMRSHDKKHGKDTKRIKVRFNSD